MKSLNDESRAVILQSIGEKNILTLKEAAAFLGLSCAYLYKLVAQRAIGYFRSRGGKRIYFERADVEAWACASRVSTNDELTYKAAKYCQRRGL